MCYIQCQGSSGCGLPIISAGWQYEVKAAVSSHWTTPWHCTVSQESFKDTLNSPSFLLSPSSSPTFSVYHTLPQRCWLVEKCGTVNAGRWSVHAPPTSSEEGSSASARNSTQLVQNPQGPAAHRRWILGYQVDPYVGDFVFCGEGSGG